MKSIRNWMIVALCGVAFISCEKENVSANTNGQVPSTKNQIGTGLGGSMAQFTIINDYLYTVDYKSLKVFHLVDAENPVLLETVNLGVGIETIFPQNDNLFIGTQNGVLIYDVSNPRSPQRVSEFDHVTSCDPVVANEDYAVATLRGGTPCRNNINELDIIDISTLENPVLVNTAELTNPYGLGFSEIDENIIYVCDGYAGLKAYNISDIHSVEMVMNMEELEAIDVIANGDVLIVLTRHGVYQFDANSPTDLAQLSVINIQ